MKPWLRVELRELVERVTVAGFRAAGMTMMAAAVDKLVIADYEVNELMVNDD